MSSQRVSEQEWTEWLEYLDEYNKKKQKKKEKWEESLLYSVYKIVTNK